MAGLAKVYNVHNLARDDFHTNFIVKSEKSENYITVPFYHHSDITFVLDYFRRLKQNLIFHLYLPLLSMSNQKAYHDFYNFFIEYSQDLMDAQLDSLFYTKSFPFTIEKKSFIIKVKTNARTTIIRFM